LSETIERTVTHLHLTLPTDIAFPSLSHTEARTEQFLVQMLCGRGLERMRVFDVVISDGVAVRQQFSRNIEITTSSWPSTHVRLDIHVIRL
jgi:hypothetical protein